MRPQRQLQHELRFLTEFHTLLDVMQQVAVSKLRRADQAQHARPALIDVLDHAYLSLLPAQASTHRLINGTGQGRLLIVFTSNESMVAALHAAVIRRGLEHREGAIGWWVIGQRGLRLLGDQVVGMRAFPTPTDDEASSQMQQLRDAILEAYIRDGLHDVWLIAPRFLSATRQDVVVRPLLPLPLRARTASSITMQELVLEPSLDRIVKAIASMWVHTVCLETWWSARRAEYAARALQVEISRQELGKQTQRIRYESFKAMHERVDVLVRETCVVRQHVTRGSS